MNYLGVGGDLERVVHSEAHYGGKPWGMDHTCGKPPRIKEILVTDCFSSF